MANTTEIKCPNCKYEGPGKAGRSTFANFIFLIGGLFTAGILWVVWIIYIVMTKNVICPKCDFKNVIRK